MTDTSIDGLLSFLKNSPSPYHACRELCAMFLAHNFVQLEEKHNWVLETGKAYFYTRSDASIVAFKLGQNPVDRGLRLVGAHTDSPCLKVKPCPELDKQGYALLGVEVYGGALLNPWFDRDLSLAGKVTGLTKEGELKSALVDFKKAIASIPSLAIHLNREANQNKSTNPQTEMNALLSMKMGNFSFRDLLLGEVNRQNSDLAFSEILDFNLSFYDVQEPSLIGLENDFIASARLDNLLSCYLGAEALIHAGTAQTTVLVCNDHEEVGSRSEAGAQGTLLKDLTCRLVPDEAQRQQMLRHSMMFSIDNAHGVHPNYADRHDDKHGPVLNQGPVIKFDADQSYASSSETAAFVRWLASQSDPVPIQGYVTRADMRCGSTIGPITASSLGIRTVDIGNPQFAMHSCRELAGVDDTKYMRVLIDRFFATSQLPF